MSRGVLLSMGIICLALATLLLVFACLQRDVCLAFLAAMFLLNALGAFARSAFHLPPGEALPDVVPESTNRQPDREWASLREEIRRERYVMAFVDSLRAHVGGS